MAVRNPYDWYITPEEYETAAANGISAGTLETRIRRLGWPKELAMTKPPRMLSKIPREIVELAQRNDIPYQTLYWRIYAGWAPERAATEPVADRAERIRRAHDARRKIPADIIELADQNGVKYTTLWKRINTLGWDPMTAATTPIMTKSESGRRAKAKREIVHKWIFARR
ncbi:MAG: hypothetical protein C6W55_12500 [Thermobacillus sp.]|uniref:hypothetical protein n=1 Tax=Thermobacillus sp. TaxID=2108467 RepID=UPI000E371D31|nr:hypothetical protein [Thermobacillus sp.]REK54054.1 MAG: hypothetical protein C6W55_12500 [Thermobacillus sp.]